MGNSDLLHLLKRMLTDFDADIETTLTTVESKSLMVEIRELERGLSTRNEIGQAQGIIMERHGLTAANAFAVLVRLSQHTNRKLTDIARELAETGVLPEDPTASEAPR